MRLTCISNLCLAAVMAASYCTALYECYHTNDVNKIIIKGHRYVPDVSPPPSALKLEIDKFEGRDALKNEAYGPPPRYIIPNGRGGFELIAQAGGPAELAVFIFHMNGGINEYVIVRNGDRCMFYKGDNDLNAGVGQSYLLSARD